MNVELQEQIDKVDSICHRIESEEEYLEELTGYLPMLNQSIAFILSSTQNPELSFSINEQFVIQTMKDILYGIEYQDDVILLDTLRYGLLEIYRYGKTELQSEEIG